MKIVLKNNSQFGGYYGYLANNNETPLELPAPFNVSANQYTNSNKDKIIELCKRDANIIFGYANFFEIVDMTNDNLLNRKFTAYEITYNGEGLGYPINCLNEIEIQNKVVEYQSKTAAKISYRLFN